MSSGNAIPSFAKEGITLSSTIIASSHSFTGSLPLALAKHPHGRLQSNGSLQSLGCVAARVARGRDNRYGCAYKIPRSPLRSDLRRLPAGDFAHALEPARSPDRYRAVLLFRADNHCTRDRSLSR